MTEARRMAFPGGVAVLLPDAPYAVRFTPAAALVGFAFDGQSGVHAFASDRLRPFRTRPNTLAATPPGCEVVSRAAGGEYLVVALDAPEAAGREQFTDRLAPDAVAAARRLRRLLLGDDPAPLAVEAAAGDLVAATAAAPQREARWMTARRRRLVDEMIEADLAGPLTVAALAAALGLSPGFFARAFREAVGTTPHDHIVERRLARARALLARGEPVAAAALATGFSSQAHLTSAMRSRLGVTPASVRAAATATAAAGPMPPWPGI